MSLPDVRLCKAMVGGLLESGLKPKNEGKSSICRELIYFQIYRSVDFTHTIPAYI